MNVWKTDNIHMVKLLICTNYGQSIRAEFVGSLRETESEGNFEMF